MNKTSEKTKKLVAVAMFCALAFIVSFCFPVKVSFLTVDAKDAIIAVGGMFFGPISALIMSVVVPFLELITNSTTGWYGLIMNFLSSAAFSTTAALVYKYKRKMSGAVLGLCSAVFFATAVMLIANYLITPLYAEYVGFTLNIKKELPRLFLPFNLTKYVLNASLVLLLYKPLTNALRASKIVSARNQTKESTGAKKSTTTIITVICASVLIYACIFVYIFVLGGKISLFG
ncbi:MAG: ECF transporter S component [Ruminococcaceae bacterium]|nr:ECF transporter S component [Oscillospiraceae bacterium]